MAECNSSATSSAHPPTCIRCLRYAEHCTCSRGPRIQRHPSECACSMCEIGRGFYDENLGDNAEEYQQ
jgi:hypothetical protein